MSKKELESFAKDSAKDIKTEKDLADFSQILTKITFDASLSADLYENLGYDKRAQSKAGNSYNGVDPKQL